MPVSTLTVKYQATIPKVVRETLALGAGDRVEFLVEPSGEVVCGCVEKRFGHWPAGFLGRDGVGDRPSCVRVGLSVGG